MVNIQIFSYRLAKPAKPIFFPKVAKVRQIDVFRDKRKVP